MTTLTTFFVPVTFQLDSEQVKEAQEALNLYYLGDPSCNSLNPATMCYEPKYPEKETPEFKESVRNAHMSCTTHVIVAMDEYGRFSII